MSGEDEIDTFLDELCSIPFSPAKTEEALQSPSDGGGEIYVFSTACDTGLPAFLLARQGRPLSLFLAQNLPRRENSALANRAFASRAFASSGLANREDCAVLRLRDFPAGGFVPLPRWFLPKGERLLNTGGGRVLIDYAETRL